jgi:hypothetical protein
MRQRELKIKRVRGFLLIVAIVLLVVVALAIAAMGNMLSSDISSSSVHAQSDQAYFTATSGTEYARRLYLTGTACGAGLNATAAVGNSSFTTSGATLINVSSSTVTSDTGTTITVGAMGAYASSGRIMIESEEIYYAGISGNSFVTLTRGISGTTQVAHAANTVVRQYLCTIKSLGASGNARRLLTMNMAAQSYQQGGFQKRSGTGTQSITGVAFQPTAVIFFWTQQTATGVSAGASGGAGFASAPAQAFGVGVAMVNNVHAAAGTTTSVEQRQRSITSPIVIFNNGTPNPVEVGRANLQSLDANGFTLNWTTSDANAYQIDYIALGGEFAKAYVGNFDMGTMVLGNNSIAAPGFEPNMVMFLNGSDNLSDNFVTWNGFPDANMTIGFSQSATARNTTAFAAHNGVTRATAIQPSWLQLTNRAITFLDQTANPPATGKGEADFVSMDVNGFTIKVTVLATVGAAPRTVGYLALRGPPSMTGALIQPTVAGLQSVTTLGFKPQGLIAVSRNMASSGVVGFGRTSIGNAGAQAGGRTIVNQSLWFQERNVAANTNSLTDMYNDATNFITLGNNSANTNTATAQLGSFLTNGFSLNWTAVDATAREVLYWAIGRDYADIQETFP